MRTDCDLENGMVCDAHWRHLEPNEQKIIGECAGCCEDIVSTKPWLEMNLKGETYLFHQDSECTYQFIADMSICRCGEDDA